MADLPDEWQRNGFDDETADWWLESGFDCVTAMKWRDARWYSFGPGTARQWADAGVPVDEAIEWMNAIQGTEYDVIDALGFRKAGKTPAEAADDGGGYDEAYANARERDERAESDDPDRPPDNYWV